MNDRTRAVSVETERRKQVDAPPIDMAYLAQQTLGDNGIAHEVLGLFLIEIGAAREAMRTDGYTERQEVAHRLKGAARAVGAFALAETAAEIERAPGDDNHVIMFQTRIGELESYISVVVGQR